MTDAPTLGSRGQIFVSLAAAQQYATARQLLLEAARRELTERMLEAKLKSDGTWRYRSRTTQLDITARVAVETPLLIVAHVSVRDYR
jgi:hypothetical protein